MLPLLSTGLLPLWLNTSAIVQPPPKTIQHPLDFLWLDHPDPGVDQLVNDYLDRLQQAGFERQAQGIWLQTDRQLLAYHGAAQPLPAASLTKVATTLATLETWPLDHTFVTEIRATGPIQGGKLEGDLVIQGGGDPLFLGAEGVRLGHTLNQLGIRQITGNLVITGPFAMDFQTNPQQVGQLLLNAFNGQVQVFESVYPKYTLPTVALPTPALQLQGQITTGAPGGRVIVQHRSLPVLELLKQLNVHSNNEMAEMFAQLMGGPASVIEKTSTTAQLPTTELLLQNGSGLGNSNRLSPRTVVGLFQAIHAHLRGQGLAISDVFPVAGRDIGTLKDRQVPAAAVVKTGTLWDVSALSGVLPTRKQGLVWFTIINRGGGNIEGFRQAQDQFLQALRRRWGEPTGSGQVWAPPAQVYELGAAHRNQVVER